MLALIKKGLSWIRPAIWEKAPRSGMRPAGHEGRRQSGGSIHQQPAGVVRRWFSRLYRTVTAGLTISIITAAMIGFAGLYGLFTGGHVAATTRHLVDQAHAQMAAAGLQVQEVTVLGRNRTRIAEVMAALALVRGTPLFAVDIRQARTRLEKLEWVAQAGVSRLLPDTIHVVLEERQPFALWQRGGRLILIDRDGHVITERDAGKYGHLPLIVGHGATRDVGNIMALLKPWPAFESRVRAFVRVGERRWNLRLDNGIDVLLPEKNIETALDILIARDQQHRLLSRDIAAVDLRIHDRLTVRLTPEALAQKAASGDKALQAPAGQKGNGT